MIIKQKKTLADSSNLEVRLETTDNISKTYFDSLIHDKKKSDSFYSATTKVPNQFLLTQKMQLDAQFKQYILSLAASAIFFF